MHPAPMQRKLSSAAPKIPRPTLQHQERRRPEAGGRSAITDAMMMVIMAMAVMAMDAEADMDRADMHAEDIGRCGRRRNGGHRADAEKKGEARRQQ